MLLQFDVFILCVDNTDGLYVGSVLGYLLGSIGGFVVGIFVAMYVGARVVGDILAAWVRLMDNICVGFNGGLFKHDIVG